MPTTFNRNQVVQLIFVGILVGIAALLMVNIWPLGVDFYYNYYPSVHKWWHGDYHLYDVNEKQVFYNTPWMMVLLAPFALVPIEIGQSALNLLSLLCLFASIHLYKNGKTIRVYIIALAVTTLFVFDLLIRGQIDAYILFGLALAWWGLQNQKPYALSIGFWLMTMKPVNIFLAGLLFLIAIRHWPRRDQVKSISLTSISYLIACLVLGLDWPLQYIRYIRDNPPLAYISIELWKGLALIGLPNIPFILLGIFAVIALLILAFKVGATPWTLSIALTTNFVFTNYAQGNHYVLLIPAFIYVAVADWRLGLLIYSLAWTPLLRGIWGYDASAIDIFYAIALLLSSWLIGWQEYKHHLKSEQTPDYTTTSVLSDRKISDDA